MKRKRKLKKKQFTRGSGNRVIRVDKDQHVNSVRFFRCHDIADMPFVKVSCDNGGVIFGYASAWSADTRTISILRGFSVIPNLTGFKFSV